MKKIFFVALAAIGMTACMQDEVMEIANGGAITFDNAFVGNATRATAVTKDNLDAFKVWGYVDNPGAVVFAGTEVEKKNGAWNYDGTQYWMPNNAYSFAAVAPVLDANADAYWSFTMETAANAARTLEFTNDGKTDLVYAYKNVAAAPSYGPVAFDFKHLLSKVKFTYSTNLPDYSEVTVGDLQVKTVRNAAINLASEEMQWEYETDANSVEIENPEFNTDYFIVPASCEVSFKVTLTAKNSVNGGSYTVVKKAVVPADAFAMGQAYNLCAEINPATLALDEIIFTVNDVAGWGEYETVGAYKDENSDKYYVASAEGLAQVAEEINEGTFEGDVVLTGDIDLAELADLLTRSSSSELKSNWVPVGSETKPFTGVFDGNGYTIKNLTLVEKEAKEGKAFIGFFGYAKNATVKNVTFENVYINIPCLDIDHSQGHIGAVAGSLEGKSLIENVTVKGDIKVEATITANGASRVAVVAGGNSYGDVTMKNVHVIAKDGSYLKANNNVGALAGQLQGKSVFENCSSNIDVTGTKFFAGGIIGLAAGDQLFTNCHTTGKIKITAGREGRANDHYRVGGIAGGWGDGKNNVCTLVNCSYTGEISGVNADGSKAEVFDYAGYVGRGYTLANCAGSKVVIDGFGYVQVYNDVYGVYSYEISSAAAFKAFADKVNAGEYFAGETVKLGADIDLNNEEWTPIGSATLDHGFCGNFDGNGYTIRNLKISALTPDADGFVYAGLFGVTEGAQNQENYVKNLVIENVDIQADGHIVAAAIAYPYYTTVENITVRGDISIKGGDYTAGVLAYTRRCVNAKEIAIEGNEGSVVEGNMTVGGVISDIQMNGGLTANYSDFSASDLTVKGVRNVGGIAGIIGRQTLNGATVENVTIVCDDVRRGIVIGALGEESTLTNVSYNNVTGATDIIGATWEEGTPVTEVDGVYKAVETIATTAALQAALADGSKASIYLAPGETFEGVFNINRNVKILSSETDPATIKGRVNVTGDAVTDLSFTNVDFAVNAESEKTWSNGGSVMKQKPSIVMAEANNATIKFEKCDFQLSTSAYAYTNSSNTYSIFNKCNFNGKYNYVMYVRANTEVTNCVYNTEVTNLIAAACINALENGKVVFVNNALPNGANIGMSALILFASTNNTNGEWAGPVEFTVMNNTGFQYTFERLNNFIVNPDHHTFTDGSERFSF